MLLVWLKPSSDTGEKSSPRTEISVWVITWRRKLCAWSSEHSKAMRICGLQQTMSGQSPCWRSKVISPSEEWITTAKADTQQHFLIYLFWDSECISAAAHQQLTEWDRTQSFMVSHCHFQRALHGATACSIQDVDKAVIVRRPDPWASTDPCLFEKSIIISLSSE